jgi:hypothetical protein
LTVGATIEDLDIYDLETLKNETTKEDILLTYNTLQKGSRNHMRAFVKVSGGNYIPQYISQSTYSSIINSPQEKENNVAHCRFCIIHPEGEIIGTDILLRCK